MTTLFRADKTLPNASAEFIPCQVPLAPPSYCGQNPSSRRRTRAEEPPVARLKRGIGRPRRELTVAIRGGKKRGDKGTRSPQPRGQRRGWISRGCPSRARRVADRGRGKDYGRATVSSPGVKPLRDAWEGGSGAFADARAVKRRWGGTRGDFIHPPTAQATPRPPPRSSAPRCLPPSLTMKRFHNAAWQKLILPLIHHAQPASSSTHLICNAPPLAGDLKGPFVTAGLPRHMPALKSGINGAH